MTQVVVQKLNKKEDSEIKLAIRYFTIIAAIAGIHITTKQIELLAFTAIRGTISAGGAIKDFIEGFDSSKGSLENMKHSLIKKGLIIKHDGKYQIAPPFGIDFKNNLVLQVKLDLENGQSEDGQNKN